MILSQSAMLTFNSLLMVGLVGFCMSTLPTLREELTTAPVSVGTFFKSGSTQMAETLGHTPLAFLLADQQHGSASHETLEEITRAADLNKLPVMVRLPGTSADPVNTVLDVGAAGVMIPQVEDVETVKRVTAEIRYDQNRSFAMSTRAGRFSSLNIDEYIEYVHEEVVVVPQIETEAGLDSVEKIAAFDSVTALMIGPADLSLSLDVSKESDKFAAAVDRIVGAANEAGCGVGIYVKTTAEIEAYEDQMTYLVYKSDISMAASRLLELFDEK